MNDVPINPVAERRADSMPIFLGPFLSAKYPPIPWNPVENIANNVKATSICTSDTFNPVFKRGSKTFQEYW
jgi:hypothetical protein